MSNHLVALSAMSLAVVASVDFFFFNLGPELLQMSVGSQFPFT